MRDRPVELGAGLRDYLAGDTIRAEEYGPVLESRYPQRARIEAGLTSAPVLVTVSSLLDLPWGLPLFSESTQRPIVFTAGEPDPDALARARQHVEVVVLGGTQVDPQILLDALEARGWSRVVCEGGPTFLNELLREDLVDEAAVATEQVVDDADIEPRGAAERDPLVGARLEPVGAQQRHPLRL